MVKPLPAHARPSYDDKNPGHSPLSFMFGWKVGWDMPGVNGICKQKMSFVMAISDVLLPQGPALRNFHKTVRPGRGTVQGSAGFLRDRRAGAR
jgi:hypothetical protein